MQLFIRIQTQILGWIIFTVIGAVSINGQDVDRIRQLTSINGTVWTPVAAPLSSFPINDVAFAKGQWVAVGDGSTILGSNNGTTWNRIHPIGEISFRSVSFANGLWVVTGEEGLILYSTNATTWNLATIPAEVSHIGNLTYGDDAWIASARPHLIRSMNGRVWDTLISPFEPDELIEVEYGGGQWLALSHRSLFTSPDAQNWEMIDLLPFMVEHNPSIEDFFYCPVPGNYRSLEYANNLWVLVGHGEHVLTSPNGRDWTFATLPLLPSEAEFSLVVYERGRWFLTGERCRGRSKEPLPYFVTSTDGIDWSVQEISFPLSNTRGAMTALSASETQWVASFAEGLLISSDSLIWQNSEPLPESLNNMWPAELHFANQRWVMGGNGGIAVSTDGKEWARMDLPTVHEVDDIQYGNGRWAATANRDLWVASADAHDWIKLPASLPGSRGIGYGDGLWVLSGGRPQLMISADLIEWKAIELLAPENVWDVHYAQNQWVAAGSGRPVQFSPSGTPTTWDRNDIIVQSSNAEDWNIVYEARHSAVGFYALGFAEGNWVVGGGGMVSKDGTNWQRDVPMHGSTQSLAYGDGRWIGVSGNRLSVWDGPGERQSERPREVRSLDLAAVAFGQGKFLAIGNRQFLQHTVPDEPPRLGFELDEKGLRISWSVNFSNYELRSALQIEGPYANVLSSPGIETHRLVHLIQPDQSANSFFRLHRVR